MKYSKIQKKLQKDCQNLDGKNAMQTIEKHGDGQA